MERRFEYVVLVVVLGLVGGGLLGCDSGPLPPAVTECKTPVASCPGPVGQWEFLGLSGEQIGAIQAIAVDRCDPRTIYAGSNFSFSGGLHGMIFKSTNCGQTWDTLLVGGDYEEIEIDPSDPEVVYAMHSPRGDVIKSTDGGQTWTVMTEGIRFAGPAAQELEIDPRRPRILYMAQSGFGSGTLFKSLNGGASWTNLDGAGTIFRGDMTGLALDPDDPSIIYVGMASGYVLKSADAGRTWNKVKLGNGSFFVNDLLVHPDSSEVVYAAGERDGFVVIGELNEPPMWRSRDGGATWAAFDAGLPERSIVRDLARDGRTGELFLVHTFDDRGALYRRRPGASAWTAFGVDSLRHRGHYNGALQMVEADRSLYFGLNGLYRMKMEEPVP